MTTVILICSFGRRIEACNWTCTFLTWLWLLNIKESSIMQYTTCLDHQLLDGGGNSQCSCCIFQAKSKIWFEKCHKNIVNYYAHFFQGHREAENVQSLRNYADRSALLMGWFPFLACRDGGSCTTWYSHKRGVSVTIYSLGLFFPAFKRNSVSFSLFPSVLYTDAITT